MEENEEVLKEEIKETPKEIPMRRIVILTNGSDIKIEEANVAGIIELVAILNAVIGFVSKKPQ